MGVFWLESVRLGRSMERRRSAGWQYSVAIRSHQWSNLTYLTSDDLNLNFESYEVVTKSEFVETIGSQTRYAHPAADHRRAYRTARSRSRCRRNHSCERRCPCPLAGSPEAGAAGRLERPIQPPADPERERIPWVLASDPGAIYADAGQGLSVTRASTSLRGSSHT
jgi:hypothetical protein